MKSSKSSLFLMELIIAILFFALASAVCIQLFVKAHVLGKNTTEENHALLLCQNLSEIFLDTLPEYYDKDPEEMKQYMMSLIAADKTLPAPKEGDVTSAARFSFLLHFNENWSPCAPADSRYHILFLYNGYSASTDTYSASAFAFRSNFTQDGTAEYEEIYHLNVCKHIPERMK